MGAFCELEITGEITVATYLKKLSIHSPEGIE
jgi:hypothetical protein